MANYVIRQRNQRGPQGATGPVVSLAANTIAGNNTSASAAATGLTASQVRDLIGSQASTSVSKTSYHTPATTAVFNGQTIDSGQTPTVTGVGIATTVSSSSGYIHDPTNTNTYIFVNGGSAIKRVEQQFQGVQGLIAICLAGDATNMVHVEFNSGSSAACTYKKSSIGSDFYQPTVAETVVSAPNLNDGTTHTLAVEVDGDTVTAFVDDVVVGFWWDANVSTVVGNWYYVQITGVTANCKIYGFNSFDELPQFNTVTAGSVTAALMQSQGYQFGRKSLAGYAPDSPFYAYTESGDIFRFVGSTNCKIQIEADGSGHPAYFMAKNALDVEFYVGLGGTNGVINHQGTDVITFTTNPSASYYTSKTFTTEGIITSSWSTTDPTGGKLWLKGGIVRHGTDSAATAASSIGLGPDDTVRHELIQVGAAGTDGEIQVWDETASVYRTLTAEQVSYLDGQQSPIVNTLADKLVNRAALRDFFAKMYAFVAAPTTTRVAVGYYGDSVASQIPEAICRLLHQESFPRCDLPYPAAMQGELSFAATGTALTYNGSTVTVDQSVLDGTGGFADFTYVPSAAHLTLANGSIVTFDGGQSTGFDEARVYLATGSGMGSAFVELINRDTSSVISSTTVSLSAGSVGATKAAFTSISKATKYKIRVTSTGASVILHACLLAQYGVMAVNFARGGSTLAQNNYSNQTIFEYLCSDLNVAMLTCEAKEEGGQTPISNAIARLAGIDNCCTLAIGSFPDSTSSVTQLTNVGYFRTAALANECAFFDAYAAGKDYTEVTRLSWQGDGTHPAQAARDYCASLILGEFNWILSLSRKFQGSVDHQYRSSNYVASYSIRTFKGDVSGDTIEVISNSGGGSPTLANLKNINRVYFDSDGSTKAYIGGRDSGSFQIYTSAGGAGSLYCLGVELTRTDNNAIYSASGGGKLGKDLVFLTGSRGVRHGSESGPLQCGGSGTPEGSITAPVGSTYCRSDGGAGTSFYVKESGTGNTGWVAK